MSKDDLKYFLNSIKANDFKVESEIDINSYLPHMIKHIGDKDMELRDELIYECLYAWICRHMYLDNSTLEKISEEIISEDYLFYKIQLQDEFAIFRRSFSALLLAILVNRHKKSPYLSRERLVKILNSIIKYYYLEKDFRGYDIENGWAHGIAHGADVLYEIVGSIDLNEDILNQILRCFDHIMDSSNNIYNHGEDNRISQVIYSIIFNNASLNKSIEKWIKEQANIRSRKSFIEADNYNKFVMRYNRKSLLRALYFKINKEGLSEESIKIRFLDVIFGAEIKL